MLNLLTKFKKFWWIVVLGVMIGMIISYSGINSNSSYRSSIALGVNYNNQEYTKTLPSQNGQNLSKLSEFMVNRFKSQEIQYQIAQLIGFDTSKISKKAFYDVVSSENGFVSIIGEFETESESQKFLNAIKQSYSKIIEIELNQNQILAFQVTPMKQFNEVIVAIETPLQVQVLPIIIGFLGSVLVILILPNKK
jgi:hypothetical protein